MTKLPILIIKPVYRILLRKISFLAFLRKWESYGRRILTIRLLKTYQFGDLSTLSKDVFEAGLKAAEGDLMETTNQRKAINILFGYIA